MKSRRSKSWMPVSPSLHKMACAFFHRICNFSNRRLRDDRSDQIHRAFQQDACGAAFRVALDLPVLRILCLRRDVRKFQRSRNLPRRRVTTWQSDRQGCPAQWHPAQRPWANSSKHFDSSRDLKSIHPAGALQALCYPAQTFLFCVSFAVHLLQTERVLLANANGRRSDRAG